MEENMTTLLESFAQCYRLCMVQILIQQDQNIVKPLYARILTVPLTFRFWLPD